MMISTSTLFGPEVAAGMVRRLERQRLEDGRKTAGVAGQDLKLNEQLVDTPESLALSQEIAQHLQQNRMLLEPLAVRQSLPFIFSAYCNGMTYKAHTDNALMYYKGRELRTDLSATVFLAAPESYEGGELVIGVDEQPVAVKLPAGGIVIYPANSLHEVRPVTAGVRWAAVTWLQSRIRSAEQRRIYRTLITSMHAMSGALEKPAGSPERVAMDALIRVKDDLLRMWSD